MQSNPQLDLANNFVQHTNRNIFLTGKAGTGKTTFLHQLKKTLHKRMAVVAPTGVAAINAGGVTIHSLFQLPFGPYIPQESADQNTAFKKQFNREKINLIKSLDLLVIDEISMVRADVLDAMDEVLRRYRTRNLPFGGVQLLMIGDLHQLSPIVKPDEWQLLRNYYDTIFFFSSRALQQTPLVNIELKHIYRQADTSFIDLLNAIRENRITQQVLTDLNRRYVPDFKPNESEGYITLTTHNNSAQNLNATKLAQLKVVTHHFKAVVQGEFPEFAYPTVSDLELKVGAQVMFVKNDSTRDKLFYNGKIGKVIRIVDEVIYVKCPGDDHEIDVSPMVWQNIKYALNASTKEVEETMVGSFTQYPLRLAWAITIHKSQSLTFDKAIIDAEDAFTHGQVYVALSRCKTLEGMVLSSPLKGKSVITDQTVAKYTLESERNAPTESSLTEAKKTFQEVLLRELFDFNPIKYKFFALLKVAEENDHLLSGKFAETLHQVKSDAEKQIYIIADKFQHELNQLFQQPFLPENNEVLQERVKKASSYFLSKLEPILLLPVQNLTVETDNKAIRKVVLAALNGLKQEMIIKFQSIKEASVNGFSALNYLQNKANAAIDFNSVSAEKNKIATKTESVSDPEKYNFPDLHNALRIWRNRLAEEKSVPAYVIFHQKVLDSLVETLPSTLAELETIKGIGKSKIQQYGEEILAYINAYCKNNNIERTPFQTDVTEKAAVKTASTVPKIDTKQVSFELFKAGKTIEEIAAERALTSGTIENHLIYFADLDELKISQIFPQEMIDKIQNYFYQNQPENLTEAKSALGDAVSYSAIRAMIRQLNYQYPQKITD